MRDILTYYQNFPMHIDPVALTMGSFSIGWYPLMYLVAAGIIYALLSYRIKKDLSQEDISDFQLPPSGKAKLSALKLKNLALDFLLVSFAGAIIGGRLGYVLFYNPLHYLNNPIEIFSPYDFSIGEFIGIYGMSYHGGLIGVALAGWLFARKNRLNFWKWADFIIPAFPAGYFFGRIGNFLNLELYGRVTDNPVGMYFPLITGAGEFLRFPSQLIEAFLEGAVLFAVLWALRNRKRFAGYFVCLYLMGYGVARFFGEFFREPDSHIGYVVFHLTLGQIFSGLMIFSGLVIYYFQKSRKIV